MTDLPPAPPAPARLTAVVLGSVLALAFARTALTPFAVLRHFSTDRLLQLILTEVVLGIVLVWQLGRHGWRWAHFARPFEARDLLRGLGVFLFAILCSTAGLLLAWALSPTLGLMVSHRIFTGHPSVFIVWLASPLNAIFEEALWLGYAVRGPGRDRPWPGAAWSVGSRCAVHVYQGPAALFLIGPLGIWYWRYFRRTGRLWPVIVGHTVQDIVALSYFALRTRG